MTLALFLLSALLGAGYVATGSLALVALALAAALVGGALVFWRAVNGGGTVARAPHEAVMRDHRRADRYGRGQCSYSALRWGAYRDGLAYGDGWRSLHADLTADEREAGYKPARPGAKQGRMTRRREERERVRG